MLKMDKVLYGLKKDVEGNRGHWLVTLVMMS